MATIEANRAWASWANLVLGIWLIISAFVWPHTTPAQTNTWILGVIIGAVALVSLRAPSIRWLNAVAAVWLFFSSFAISHDNLATVWNNAIVAIVVFVIAVAAAVGAPTQPSVRRTVRV